jgi:hypothetical protein
MRASLKRSVSFKTGPRDRGINSEDNLDLDTSNSSCRGRRGINRSSLSSLGSLHSLHDRFSSKKQEDQIYGSLEEEDPDDLEEELTAAVDNKTHHFDLSVLKAIDQTRNSSLKKSNSFNSLPAFIETSDEESGEQDAVTAHGPKRGTIWVQPTRCSGQYLQLHCGTP